MNPIKTILAGGLIAVGSSAAYAQGQGQGQGQGGPNDDPNPEQELIDGLNSMAQGLQNPPGQNKRPDDPDMGDDNAAKKAILTVCTKDTPAADRSAICDDQPVSPE